MEPYAQAGRELAMITCAVIQKLRFEEVPRVSYSGGIFSAGELVLKPLRAAMDVPAAFQPPLPDPAEGAVLLAAERYPPPPRCFPIAQSAYGAWQLRSMTGRLKTFLNADVVSSYCQTRHFLL